MTFDGLHNGYESHHGAEEAAVSSVNVAAASSEQSAEPKAAASAGKPSEQLYGRRFDLHHYRVIFPDRWRDLLHAHFRDPVDVAWTFGVSEKAARNWWEGTGAPRAEFALAAVKHIPGAAQLLLDAA